MTHSIWLAVWEWDWIPSHEEMPACSACAFALDKYNTSECIFKIISGTWNCTVASVWVAKLSRSCFVFCILFLVPCACLLAIVLRTIFIDMATCSIMVPAPSTLPMIMLMCPSCRQLSMLCPSCGWLSLSAQEMVMAEEMTVVAIKLFLDAVVTATATRSVAN